MDATFLEL